MNNTEYITLFLYEYFSHWQNALFWLLVLAFSLYESIKARYKKNHKMKLWMKKHNIKPKTTKEPESYIDACWEEINKH